jgi:uncharacterized membrane protein
LAYSGSFLACVIAARIVQKKEAIAVWLYSGAAHLLVLTIAVYTRYFIYDGDIFAKQFNLIESSVYIFSWATIGIIYDWKLKSLAHYSKWYKGLSLAHIIAAATLFVFYNMIAHNPLWYGEDISTVPVLNLLLLAYAMPVVLAVAIYRRIPALNKAAGLLSVIALYLFATLEVRHFWQNGYLPLDKAIDQGELYTYSLVWLLMSLAMMILGVYKSSNDLRRVGGGVLLVVIAKVFLWDMNGLDGLWRVVSFLGLGLSLLGIAYLFSRLKSTELKPL